MKKKELDDLKTKPKKELSKESYILREEIARMRLELKVNPPKDTNLLVKKRKRLAAILTILSQKME